MRGIGRSDDVIIIDPTKWPSGVAMPFAGASESTGAFLGPAATYLEMTYRRAVLSHAGYVEDTCKRGPKRATRSMLALQLANLFRFEKLQPGGQFFQAPPSAQ
jgi:hypothetical protein